MNPLPLLTRELLVATRKKSTHAIKLTFGGGSMLVAVWSLLVTGGGSGLAIFQVLAWLAGILAVLAAIFIASDCIARERREGTLGFLFLTDLRPMDVVLGKFAANGLLPTMALVAMFPAFGMCQLIGGIPVGLFWRTLLALILVMIFSLSATIFVSSFCEDHRKAYGGSTLLLAAANPLWLLYFAGNFQWITFLGMATAFSLWSGCFLYWSAKRLENGWRDNGVRSDSAIAKREWLSPALLEHFPVAWMMLRRQRLNRRWTILAFVGVVVLLLGLTLPNLGIGRFRWDLLAALLTVHIGYQFILIARTAYSFYSDRQNGALELLLGTRLLNEEIFEGFNQFLYRKSLLFIGLLTVIDAGLAIALWNSGGKTVAVLPLAMAAGLWITLFGLGWLGVYRSLMMNHPSLAMLATFARLSLVPVLMSLLFIQVPGTDYVKLGFFYVVASGFLAAFFSLDAKAALIVHGRTLLLRPYSEKPPHIENEWSFIAWEGRPLPEGGTPEENIPVQA